MSVATRLEPAAASRQRWPDPSGTPPLPDDVAFLREFGVAPAILAAAARSGRLHGVNAATALLASGGVTDTLFYNSLARFVDLPFESGWPALPPRIDAAHAIAIGRVALADGSWLLAPTGADLRLLLRAAREPDLIPRRMAITTPARFEALVLRRAGDGLARRASLALPVLAPRLSARGVADRRAALAATFCGAGTFASYFAAPIVFWTAVALIFAAGIVLRFVACASGLPRPVRRAPIPAAVALPSYTVLVPLFHEANMAAEIVRHLAAIDYPAGKLEVLLLVEAVDAATRTALSAVAKPATMRIVTVPQGDPRTKPRALNLGLALARGALIAVFDAEDRPDPQQLRLAAAGFAAAEPELACLQGRLAIRDHRRGLLTRLFALEYAVLFDLHNVGVTRLGMPLPLGGTSNHFRGMGQQAPKVG